MLGILLKFIDTPQFLVKMDNNNGNVAWKPTRALARGSDWVGNTQQAVQQRQGILHDDVITQPARRQTPRPRRDN